MLSKPFTITQTYTFQNREEIERILKIDSIGKVIFYEDDYDKVIEYQIESFKCIRLSDLVYWIESDFLSFHLGQLLMLFTQLIQKVQNLKKQNIEHNYLDINRIWLQLKDGSQLPSIVYTSIQYTICFTGYQCPIYERNKYSNDVEDSIKTIIDGIIQKCKDHIEIKYDAYQKIYQPIMELCEKKQSTLENLLQFINQILSNCDTNSQTLPCDVEEVAFKRQNRQKDIVNEMKIIMANQLNRNCFDLELTYFFAIKFLTNKISQGLFYSKENFDYSKTDYYSLKSKKLVDDAIEQDGLFQQNLIIQVDDYIRQQEKEQIFQFSVQERTDFVSEIYEEVRQLRSLNYFFNTIWIQLNNYSEIAPAIQVIVTQKVIQMMEVIYKECVYSKKLELISKLK